MTDVSDDDRVVNEKELSIVPTIEEFKNRFYLFHQGVLDGLNWTNILCAGGCVLGIKNIKKNN